MSESNSYKIFLKGEDRTRSVLTYEYHGPKCLVIFKSGKSFFYNRKNVRIIESALKDQNTRECFNYLKEIADGVGIKVEFENQKTLNILSYNYEKIKFVDPSSLLASFLAGKLPIGDSSEENLRIVFPFGFNSSQKNAVEKALSNRLSVIEGPPGTGKTQTILNILANIIMRGQTVAVVSSNNSATKNVFDKLMKHQLSFLVAFLGNKSNRQEFIEEQSSLPDLSGWEIAAKKLVPLQKEMLQRQKELSKNLELEVECSQLKQKLSQVEVEQKHFENYAKESQGQEIHLDGKIKSSSAALELWLLCETVEKKTGFKNFLRCIFELLIKWRSKKRIAYQLLEIYPREQLIESFQHIFYSLKILELKNSISKINHKLETYDYEAKMKEYTDDSMKLFKNWCAKYYKNVERKEYNLDDLIQDPKSFLKDYPVILSTTYSLKSSLSDEVKYDYLIIDEASQVDICTGALAMSCAENVVIVGDLKQLSHVVDNETATLTDGIFEKFHLSESFRYKDNSLLSSIIGLFPNVPKTLLREHYRCHPKIIEFCNKKFYNDKLIILTKETSQREPLIVYKTVKGNHERNRMNQRQIDMIKDEIIPDLSLSLSTGTLGIITPYRNQTNQLQMAFKDSEVKADTVDKFQGQEKPIIILSTVDNEITNFTDDENRLNVAISRAIDQLILVVNDSDTLDDSNIGDLVRFIEYNNFSTIESKVYSVFDYLYRCYAEQRKAYLAKKNKVSNFDSENLMNVLIENILIDEQFKKLGVATHVPLKMIIRDLNLLNSEEKKYALNIHTHVDFLIYDKMGKVPKLAIEVDGVAFHKQGSKQEVRDKMKNEIFLKYELPLLRFRTDGSSEGDILRRNLERLVGVKKVV